MGETLGTLLRAASEPVADVRPPDLAELVARRRRRTGLRTATAVLVTVGATVTLSVVVSRPGSHPVAHPATTPPVAPPTDVVGGQLATYQWRSLPGAPITPRDGAAAVWTGQQLIVWGGTSGAREFRDGATYSPATRTWTTLPASPLAGGEAQAVWTGSTMLVWTGADGAEYHPVANRWTAVPRLTQWSAQPLRALLPSTDRVIVLHGPGGKTAVHADAYDPRAGSWHRLADVQLPAGHGAALVTGLDVGGVPYAWVDWTHSRKDGPGSYEVTSGVDGYRYAGGHWRAIPAGPDRGFAPTGVVLVGRQVFFPQTAGTCVTCPGPMRFRFRGRLVDPATGAGRAAPELDGVGRGDYVSTGSGVLALNTSTEMSGAHGTKPGDLAAWQPGQLTWRRLPSVRLGHGEDAAVVWAGDRLLVWGSQGGLEFAG